MAARTRELVVKAAETYVIFNNHPAGQAVANALELIHLLTPTRPVSVPPGLLAAFPRLAETVMGEKDGKVKAVVHKNKSSDSFLKSPGDPSGRP